MIIKKHIVFIISKMMISQMSLLLASLMLEGHRKRKVTALTAPESGQCLHVHNTRLAATVFSAPTVYKDDTRRLL